MTRAKDAIDEDQASQDSAPDAALDVNDDEGGDVLDFSGVSSYDAVPAEKPYICTLDKLASGTAKSGNKKYDAEFTVSEPIEYAGQKITTTYTIASGAMFGIFNLLVAMGKDPEELKASKDFKLVPEEYLGMQGVVFAQDNLYNGRTSSRVQRVAPIGEWDDLKAIWDENPEEGNALPF